MSQRSEVAQVLSYYRYLGAQSVYNTRHFCGSCRRALHDCYHFPEYPEELEAQNETSMGLGLFSREREALEYFSFCPWCGIEFEDEWWKDRVIQNERVIDHYQNPGTHKGDMHEFRGDSPDCIANHWLAVSGDSKICWCDPDVEPGLMGCVIRHQDKRYEDIGALRPEMASSDVVQSPLNDTDPED